jgi:hypothetical protein
MTDNTTNTGGADTESRSALITFDSAEEHTDLPEEHTDLPEEHTEIDDED